MPPFGYVVCARLFILLKLREGYRTEAGRLQACDVGASVATSLWSSSRNSALSDCLSMHSLTAMSVSLQVSLVGSGNWGTAVGKIVAANAKDSHIFNTDVGRFHGALNATGISAVSSASYLMPTLFCQQGDNGCVVGNVRRSGAAWHE